MGRPSFLVFGIGLDCTYTSIFRAKNQTAHKKILQDTPKGLKTCDLKYRIGLAILRRLPRRCQGLYDFPYDLYDFPYDLYDFPY